MGLRFTDIQTSSLGVEAEGEYASDVPIGLWTYWHPNGAKRAEGTFSAGKMSGIWQFWKADGSVDSELSGLYAGGARTSANPR
ncbi:MAG: hypothetical protein IPJ19_19900 [Planctomycetes bacterium]|nr:hypothetical protein [Planctomycetota bacterium]